MPIEGNIPDGTTPKPRAGRDNLCKFLAERHPAQLVEWLFGVRGVPVEIVKTELSREPVRADAAILLASTDELFHIEFQTTARSRAPLGLRMLDYYVGFQLRFPAQQIRQAMVVLHDNGEPVPHGYESPAVSFRYLVLKLWEQSAADLLTHEGLLSLAVLCRAESGGAALLQTVAERIRQLPDVSERREQMSLAQTLAGLRFRREDIYRVLQGGNMLEESVVYQDILHKGMERGLQQGLQQGLLQGLEQGLERERRFVLQLLTYRFGRLSPALHKRFARLSLEQVEGLGTALLDFKEKADLTAWLKQHAT